MQINWMFVLIIQLVKSFDNEINKRENYNLFMPVQSYASDLND